MDEGASKIIKRAKGQIIMLAVIFLAGMAINVLGMPSEAEGLAMVISGILTGLHVFIGIGLIVGSIIALRMAHKGLPQFVGLAWTGMTSVLVAFVAGMVMMATDNDWWSFVMAAGFLAAILTYGSILVQAQKR